jgi:hypothetical protein
MLQRTCVMAASRARTCFLTFACFLTLLAAPAAADPKPTPTPSPAFAWSAAIRAYSFARINANTCLSSGCDPKGTPNSFAFNSGIRLHGEYHVSKTPFSLGGTYFGAEPFNFNPFGVLGVGYNPQVDNTLPGYGLSSLAEMYVAYQTPGVLVQTGKEVIDTPWANAADSRIVPIAFQGTLATAHLSPTVTVEGMYMARFKSRVTSAFNANTLLTSCNTAYPTGKGPIEGEPGTFTVEGDQCNTVQSTRGFWLIDAAYEHEGLKARAYQYHMYDLVDLTYADVSYDVDRESALRPVVAAQYWGNNNTGSALLGSVHSYGYGMQIGMHLTRAVVLTLSYNEQSVATYVVPADRCTGTASSGTKPDPGVIFGGVQDTSQTDVPSGDVVCYGGGTASPYTDSYESDPLYTSSIGEGLTDARKGGYAAKAALATEAFNHRLKILLTQARYNVSLPGTSGGTSNVDIRTETNFDVQYFFSPVIAGKTYRGLSFRERLVDRVQTFSPFDFKYIRTQLQYDF